MSTLTCSHTYCTYCTYILDYWMGSHPISDESVLYLGGVRRTRQIQAKRVQYWMVNHPLIEST